ncbi:MAG: patatin family protein [Ruminococcaceae bacterium]|nr:patatin family protein [Oscillospiraceae bacterium]
MKTGLILEGGAMRGLFSAGVIDIFMENGIEFDAAIGVSAGAAFGCNYKSRQIGRVIRYNKRFAKDWRFCSLRSLIKTGNLFGAEFCYHTIPDEIDIFDTETYLANPMDFYVVCTDVETGKAVYINSDEAGEDSLEYFRASASMPLVSTPVEIKGKKYLDGGIADSVPIQYFESIGYNKNVIILTQPLGFVKKPSSAAKLMKYALKQYPMIAKTMENRHNEYNETLAYIAEKEKSGEVLVIRPESALDIGRTEHDPERMQKVYDLGRAAGEKYLDKVKEFIK